MEKEHYSGPWTEIKLEHAGMDLGSVMVPFSQEEVEAIRKLEEIREGWGKEAIRGSGWTRELYLDVSIPWGHTLKNRQEALEEMRKTLHVIRDTRARAATRNIQEVADLADDLDALEEGLLQFLPEEEEPNLHQPQKQ